MNCFEFRKLALSNPYNEDSDFVQHRAECPDCEQHIRGVLAMDAKLAAAISVEVPADLKAKLKLRQVIDKEQRSHRVFKRYSIAASTFLAVALGWFAYQNQQLNTAYLALYNDAMQHVESDSYALTSVQPTAQTRMKMHLASYAGLHVGELPGLRYSQICPIGTKRAWHAVMETASGLVTVLYLKDSDLSDKDLEKKGKYSRLINKSVGDIMLIGDTPKSIDEAESVIERSLTTLI